jgi:hypothetical protein
VSVIGKGALATLFWVTWQSLIPETTLRTHMPLCRQGRLSLDPLNFSFMMTGCCGRCRTGQGPSGWPRVSVMDHSGVVLVLGKGFKDLKALEVCSVT